MTALSSLSLSRKFALLAAIGGVLFLLPFTFYVRQLTASLHTIEAEQAGIAPALSVLHLVQLTQQHRGLFNAGMQEPRARKQAEADAAFSAFARTTGASFEQPELAARWKGIEQEWQSLCTDIGRGSVAPAEGLARHTMLVEHELDLVALLTETSGLAYDADPGAHHIVQAALVELPKVSETLGLARARGAAYLSAGQVSPAAQMPIAALAQASRGWRRSASESLRKSTAVDANLRSALGAAAQAALADADKGLALVDKEILGMERSSLAPEAYFRQMTAAIDATFNLQALAAQQLGATFQARISAYSDALVVAVAGIVAAAAVVILLGIAIARSISLPIRASVRLAQRVAQGDLTVRLEARGRDEIGQLQQALSTMVQQLRDLLAEVVAGAERVSDSSAQIAQGNLDLSQRTEEQASTLEETATSMEELTATVAQNAEGARQASHLAREAAAVAREGGAAVQGVVTTMSEITTASARIRDITLLIDGIAFQTNILALNAAVEAARAGTHGRGFAVVAAEVRSLSQRCASAAREIKGLISDSVEKVGTGAKLVDSAGDTMQHIVDSVEKLNAVIAEIAAASREQSTGIGQINTAISQMDLVVQQNASLVEEAAAATGAMNEEASALRQLVAKFRLRETTDPASAHDQEERPVLPIQHRATAATMQPRAVLA